MRQLRFAGPGEDAAHVIVESPDGLERFALILDDALRTAARQELPTVARPGSDAERLSPRDIQTRVRGGSSPQAIADEAGVAVDRVLRFAHPVLQERVRVADEARRARARRSSVGGEMGVFGDVVDGQFAANGVEPADVHWDSFRRPDGQWTVTAGWRDGDDDRFAQWTFALATRVISALDDTAADLLSDRTLRPVQGPEPEDVATVGGAFDPAGLDPGVDPAGLDPAGLDADPTRPTGPLPTGLRLAPTPLDRTPLDDAEPATPHPSFQPAADPSPRGLDSFFTPRRMEMVPAPAEPAPDDDSLLPLQLTPAGPDTRARGGSGSASGSGSGSDAESPDSKASRARIPSWDDILLGVRRRGD